MKKWLAMLLSIILTVQLAVPAWAADGGAEQPETVASVVKIGTCGDNLTWTLDDGGVLAISGTGVIRDTAFRGEPKIKTVIVGDGVTSIGYSAFSSCSNLTSVEIPDSVTSIGDYAFSNCSSLTSITIPDGVTSIGSSAFSQCSSLTSVEIPDSVTSIGNGAFYGSRLTDVYYGGSRTEWNEILIGGDNDQLTGANIHCTKTDSTATTGASGTCGVNLTWILTDDGTLTISGTGVMHNYDSLGGAPWYGKRSMIKCLIIEPGVANIGDNAFGSCTNLTSVEIPDSVTIIGDCAFYNCSSLASITISDSVTSIGDYAFHGCNSLTSVEIPDSVTIIRFNAFSYCNSLSSITIPNSVKTIDQAAFSNCSSLTSITILDGVATIGWSAFSDCSSLTSITIPDSVTSIGGTAFSGCSALTDVYYGGSRAEWIKIRIDTYNDQLWGANIHYAKTDPTATPTQTPMPTPIATPFPGPTATPAEPSVPTSGICGENLTWKIEDGVLIISGTGAMTDYSWCKDPSAPWGVQFKSVVIESGVTSIGDSAFYGSSLTSITIPDSVTSIGDYAFGRGSLTSIAIPDSVTSIGECAFEFCNLTSITIPDSVTSIGDNAFYGSSLTSIAIPDNVTNIGEGVFCDCTNLADDDGFVIVRNVLCGYFGKDADVAVPTGVTRIDKAAFAGCSSLASITIPDSITSIGREAFSGCSNLMSITIPSGVTSIGNHAFYNCSSLTSVEIPDSVASIGSNAFYNCTALKNVYYSSCSEAKWNSISIQSGNDDLKNAAMHYSDHRWDEGVITKPATRTEEGEKTFTCAICRTIRTETIPALTPEPDSVDLNEIAKDFDGSSIGVDVDGKTVYPDGEGNYPRLTVPEGTTTLISVSTCNLPEGVDPHTRYPVGMAVYKATNTDGTTSVERISEMDDLLRYAGSSIRITGNKGIRLITGINASLKSALTSEGVAGYTLEEYGTLLCWASEVQNGSLSLSDAYARHNYAYSVANGTDPVFRYAGDVVQYTNVLVGFSNEQCVDDIAMRPYITLRDADGNTYTLYGGIVNRSIGYIAYQNRGAFTPGTNAYNYIWDIIHFVYGDAYDEDYKG